MGLHPRAHSLQAVLMGLHDASHAVYLLGIAEDDLSLGACKSKSSAVMVAPTLRGSHLLATQHSVGTALLTALNVTTAIPLRCMFILMHDLAHGYADRYEVFWVVTVQSLAGMLPPFNALSSPGSITSHLVVK